MFLGSCSDNKRIVILDRWPNGSKKHVVTYKGEGYSEKVIEERIYTNNGVIYKSIHHSKTQNDTLNIYELNTKKLKIL